MSKRKLAVAVLCLVTALSMLEAQDVFVAAGSGSTDTQVSAFTTPALTPYAGFQSGPGTLLVLGKPDGSKFYSIADSAAQPITVASGTLSTPHSITAFTESPTGALLTPDGTRLAVAAGTLHVFETTNDTELVPGGISVGTGATIIDQAVSLDGKTYFTLATLTGGGSQLNSINTANNTIVGTLQVLGTATGLTVGPNNLVYVSTQNQILEVNPVTLVTTPNGVISLNALPTKPVVTPDSLYLLAGNLTPVTGSSLLLISLASHSLVSTFTNSIGFSFQSFVVLGVNEILALATEDQGYFEINPNNGGPIAVNSFGLPQIATSIQAMAISDEVGVSPRTTAETLYASSGGSIYALDIPSNTITKQQTLTDPKLGGAVSFAGASSTGVQPSSLLIYGTKQTVIAGGTSLPLVAQALDPTGRPIFGATITFTPNSSSVTVSPASAITGANGYAVAYLTAGSTTGAVAVNVAAGTATASIPVNIGSSGGGNGSGGGNTISIVAGQGQIVSTASSTTLTGTPLTVQVSDSNGNPVPGAAVNFAISGGSAGAGSLSAATGFGVGASAGSVPGSLNLITTSVGRAGVNFSGTTLGLGTQSAQSQVVATSGNSSITFFVSVVNFANAPSGYLLAPSQGASLTGQAGTTLPGAVQVQILAGNGVPLPNVAISLSNGGLDPTRFPSASCSGGLVLTSANGSATCNVVFGGVVGTENFSVNFGNFLNSPDFEITTTVGPPAEVNIVQGNNQTGIPGQILPQALVVQVTDSSGNGLSAVPVTWQVVNTGAVTLSNVSSATDQNGHASALATLGNIGGVAKVQVTAGPATATFSLTTNIPEAGLQKVSGDVQTAQVNTAFGAPVVVLVVDANGNPVANAQVTFAVTAGSATLGSSSATTGTNGQASTTVTAGGAAGSITITATAGNLSVTFALTVAPQGATNVTFVNGASFQTGIAPGGIALMSGNGLAPNVEGILEAFNFVGPLPTSLAGVSITFNGTPVPIYYISNQSNNGQQTVALQVPFEVAPGTVAVEINISPCSSGTSGCDTTTVLSSTTVMTTVQQVAPGVFTSGTQNQAVVVRPDGSYVTPANPAQRGEIVQLYATGLGLVIPPPPSGAAGLAAESVLAKLVVGLNNAGVPFQSADYAPGMVGVYVITFQIPLSTKPGAAVPIGLLEFDAANKGHFGQNSTMAIQ